VHPVIESLAPSGASLTDSTSVADRIGLRRSRSNKLRRDAKRFVALRITAGSVGKFRRNHDVGLDADSLKSLAIDERVEDREIENRAILQHERAAAEDGASGSLADQRGPAASLERTGNHFLTAARPAVDDQDKRAAPLRVDDRSPSRPVEHRERRHLFEKGPNILGRTASEAVAKIDDERVGMSQRPADCLLDLGEHVQPGAGEERERPDPDRRVALVQDEDLHPVSDPVAPRCSDRLADDWQDSLDRRLPRLASNRQLDRAFALERAHRFERDAVGRDNLVAAKDAHRRGGAARHEAANEPTIVDSRRIDTNRPRLDALAVHRPSGAIERIGQGKDRPHRRVPRIIRRDEIGVRRAEFRKRCAHGSVIARIERAMSLKPRRGERSIEEAIADEFSERRGVRGRERR
jgi:hypothetical protein